MKNTNRLDSMQILLDGRPLPEYNVRFLRETIGVVSQEPVLFDTTIEVRSVENDSGTSRASDVSIESSLEERNNDETTGEHPLRP